MYVYCGNNPIMFSDPTDRYYVIQNGNEYTVRQVHDYELFVGAALHFVPVPFISNISLARSRKRYRWNVI